MKPCAGSSTAQTRCADPFFSPQNLGGRDRGSGVQDNLLLHKEFNASLGYRFYHIIPPPPKKSIRRTAMPKTQNAKSPFSSKGQSSLTGHACGGGGEERGTLNAGIDRGWSLRLKRSFVP